MPMQAATPAMQTMAGVGGASPGRIADRVGAAASALMLLGCAAVMLDVGSERTEGKRSEPSPATSRSHGTGETLLAGYVGYPYTHGSDLHFDGPAGTKLTVHDVEWEGRPFKSPIYYGLRASRWTAGSPLGAMIDFTHSKAIAVPDQKVRFSGERNGRPAPPEATVRETFKHMEFSHGHNMLTLNGLWRLAPAAAGIVPYVGAGAGVNLPHTEVQFVDDPERTYEYQYTGPVGQVVAGIEIRLPYSSVFIEYKFTLARYVAPLTGRDSRFSYGPDDFFWQLVDWWRGNKPKYGTVTTTLASHQVIGGAGWRAGGAIAAQ